MPTMTPNVPPLSFGASLRAWRHNQTLSQAALGALLSPKVGHSVVCRWESGHRIPSRSFLQQLIALTGISPSIALGIQSQDNSRP